MTARQAAGRDYEEWFALLDGWGAPGRPYREIAGWLRDTHGLSAWWAQKLIVEYEQARGLREAGVRPDGTFSAGASKTVNVPAERVYAAIADPGQRSGWLPGVVLRERTSRPGRSIRFDVVADRTRLRVTVEAKGDKSLVAVEHELLPDAGAARQAKALWRDRLAGLKAMLESATS